MKLRLAWMKRLPLSGASSQNLIYTCDIEKIPDKPGVYVFGRMHGRKFEALYVGKGNSVRSRVKTQFKNLPLMKHVEKAMNGRRVLWVGQFMPAQGQQIGNCLPLIERTIIRHFLSEGHNLSNLRGTILKRHEIISADAGKSIPGTIFLNN
jgi:hypothetical protein